MTNYKDTVKQYIATIRDVIDDLHFSEDILENNINEIKNIKETIEEIEWIYEKYLDERI